MKKGEMKPPGRVRHANPGPGSTREEAQKANIAALRFLDQIWELNRKDIEAYVRENQPSVEVIAALAFLTIRSMSAMVREVNVSGVVELRERAKTDVVAKYLVDTFDHNALAIAISKGKKKK